MLFKGMGEAIKIKPKNSQMNETEILSVFPIAPAVNNQIEMKQKTGKEKHTRTETTLAS